MKKLIISLSLVIFASVTFTSCKNDLNVLAPGKEVVSVYGILNPNEPIQNIRINKIFVTTGDANAAAKDQSVINFDANELVVTLERYNTGSTTKLPTTQGNPKTEIVLTETVITTADGAFSNQQRVWQTTDKLYHTGEYKLVIKKSSDLNTIIASAQTVVIDSVSTSSGGASPNPFYYINATVTPMHGDVFPSPILSTDKPKFVDYSVFTLTQYIKFKSIANAKTYDVLMRFHYFDTLTIKTITNTDSVLPQYVDYNFDSQQSNALTGGELFLSFKFVANDFYTNLGREIAKKGTPNVKNRKANYMEYIVNAGTENLYTFLQVNAPSTTIAQDKPYYSNITGGVGIFACRSTSIVTKDLWDLFKDKIACNPNTFPYLFCDNTTGKPASTTCP